MSQPPTREHNFGLIRLVAASQVAIFHLSSQLHVPLNGTRLQLRSGGNGFMDTGGAFSAQVKANPSACGGKSTEQSPAITS